MNPDALVVGPMKSGTTWLYDYLDARSDVCLPHGVKETFFFDRNFDKGFQWYASHFDRCDVQPHLRTMEIAPSYFHGEAVPERTAKALGNIPIIITLRDPVKRSWSHYLHLKRKGYTRADLQQACIAFPEILAASRFAENLQRWGDWFPRQQIHILWQEDLAVDPDAYAQRFTEVLGLPWYILPETLRGKSNEATVPPSALLASLGTRVSNRLRSNRFYGVVNMAKKLGMKRIFYGTPTKGGVQTMSRTEATWLAEQLAADFDSLPTGFLHPQVQSPLYYLERVAE